MKRVNLFLMTLVLGASMLVACGGNQTSTSVPGTNVPPVTVASTSAGMPTSAATTPTSGTLDLTNTPNVPVTGEESPSRLTNLMDYKVLNQNGDQIGKVDDLVLDFDHSNIAYVVAGTGGFLGMGEKEVLVPWKRLKLQTGANGGAGGQSAFVFNGNQDLYKNAPNSDVSSLLPGTGQPATSWDAGIQNYWQNGATGQAVNTPGGSDMTAGPIKQTTPKPGLGIVNGPQRLQGVILASNLLGATVQAINSSAGTHNGQAQGPGTETPASPPLPQATATGAASGTGIGSEIGTTLGTMDMKVDDLIVAPDGSGFQYVVVKGAFTNGQFTIPVPFKFLQWDAANQKFTLGVNMTGLVNAPSFDNGQYPDFSNGDWYNKLNKYWNNLGSDVLIATPMP